MRSLICAAMEAKNSQFWDPALRLSDPGVEDAEWTDHQIRSQLFRTDPILPVKLFKILERRQSLQCLAEAHLVTQDPRKTVVVEVDKERQARKLIRLHRCGDTLWLFCELLVGHDWL